ETSQGHLSGLSVGLLGNQWTGTSAPTKTQFPISANRSIWPKIPFQKKFGDFCKGTKPLLVLYDLHIIEIAVRQKKAAHLLSGGRF
ncbi:hypothetical protein, partial [Malonomonas rubra]|uniref:hypothetical protein n=1 Tax=Malonomonas rubra TaxID=57040 RepID=UPI001ABF08FB